MVDGKQIKVIKRAEQRRASQAALSDKSRAIIRGSNEIPKRDTVAVVTGWVRELRQKKVEEAARGFEGLFRKAA